MLTDDPVEAARRRALEDQMYGGGMGGQIRGLLDQFQPTQADRDAARKAQLQTFFLSLLGTQRGNEFGALGRGGLLANAAYNQTLDNSQKAAMERMQAAHTAMALQTQMREMQSSDAFNDAITAQPSQQPKSPMQAAMGQAPSLSPTTANVGAVQQAAASAPAQGQFEKMVAQADQYEALAHDPRYKAAAPKLLQAAQKIRDDALKFRNKNTGTKVAMDANGKPVFMQESDYAPPSAVQGFAPPPETAVMDQGGYNQVYDKLRTPAGSQFAKTMTPEQAFNAPIQQANLGISQAHLKLAQDAAKRAAANDDPNKPKWDSASGQFLYPPSAAAPGGRAVSPEGFTKPDKPLTESQANATGFGMRARAAADIFAELEKSGAPVGSPVAMLANHPVSNYAAPDWAQQARQAKLNFMTANLRKESGATISPSEFDTEDKKYFPQPGDKPGNIEQKRQMRELAIKSLAVQAGAGASNIKSGSATAAIKRTGTVNGRKVVEYADGRIEYAN
jgi:hypothetical protein